MLFGKEDKLKLGHFVSAVDQRLDPPHERIHFLDYMAPEMLSVRLDENGNALPVAAAAVAGGCLAQVGWRMAPCPTSAVQHWYNATGKACTGFAGLRQMAIGVTCVEC